MAEETLDMFKDVFTKTGSYELLYLMTNLVLGRLRTNIKNIDPEDTQDPDVADLVKDCVKFAKSKISPPNPVDFVSQLPGTYIILLIVAKKILQSGVEYATFERMFENYKEYHRKVMLKPMKLERAQMLKIFLDLIKMGMLVPDQPLDSEMLHKSKVTLRITSLAFDQFITKDKSKIPEQMKEWASTPLF